MRVLVFGASGRTGRELVTQALGQGHRVTAFVRDPAKLISRSPDLALIPGDVVDLAAVHQAVRGQDAVISALGASTPFRRDPRLVDGVRNIVSTMEQMGVRRLVYVSYLGVHDGRSQLSLLGRYLVAPLARAVVADHEAKEALIRQSGLEWVIVRPPLLTNGPRTGEYRSGQNIEAKSLISRISRADVADFMLRQLCDDTYVRRAPALMY